MRIIDLLSEVFQSLVLNRLRTFLTLLGIVIGISAIITMASLIEGMKNELLTIFNVNQARAYTVHISNPALLLTQQDYKNLETLISQQAERIGKVSHWNGRITGTSTSGNTINTGITLTAYQQSIIDVQGLEMIAGRMINQTDEDSMAKTIVISEDASKELFATPDEALSKTVQIDGDHFLVVGVYKTANIFSGYFSPFAGIVSQNLLETRLAPLQEHVQSASYSVIARPETDLYAVNKDVERIVYTYVAQKWPSLEEAMQQGTSASTDYFEMPEQSYDDSKLSEMPNLNTRDRFISVSVMTNKSMIDQLEVQMTVFQAITTSVSSISLIIGGIGIMNMMLTNVTERIREIGIRKALGAQEHHIVLQFLIESIMLCLLGGILGTLLGLLFAQGAAVFVGPAVNLPNLKPAISFEIIMITVNTSSLIGIVFGWLPAIKAARLNVTEALRHQ